MGTFKCPTETLSLTLPPRSQVVYPVSHRWSSSSGACRLSLHLKTFSSNASYFSGVEEFVVLGKTETAACVSPSGGPRQVRMESHSNSQTRLTLLFLEPRSKVPFWECSVLPHQRWGRAQTSKSATKPAYHFRVTLPWISVELVFVNLCFLEFLKTWFWQLVFVLDVVVWWWGWWGQGAVCATIPMFPCQTLLSCGSPL